MAWSICPLGFYIRRVNRFVEDFGAKLLSTFKQVSTRAFFFFFCIRSQNKPLTFDQCLSYFDSFKLRFVQMMSLTFDLFTEVS